MKHLFFAAALLATTPAIAWDGFDWDSGTYVEIDDGNLVREGEDIEIFRYDGSGYRDVEVIDIDDTFGGVEIEVYDYRTGKYYTLDMDD